MSGTDELDAMFDKARRPAKRRRKNSGAAPWIF